MCKFIVKMTTSAKQGAQMLESSLATFRKQNHLTLRQMAEKLETSQSLYNKIEYMERKPQYDFVAKFAQEFPEADIRSIFYAHVVYEK